MSSSYTDTADASKILDPVWPEMKGSFDMQKLGGLTINSPSSPRQSFEQLDVYILSYWSTFDPLYPVIHRPTFNASENRLLAFAMAAIGTQYHSAPHVRKKGVELNDHCRKSIDLVSVAFLYLYHRITYS